MTELVSCKNNLTRKVEVTMVPGFSQLGVLCGGICAECNLRSQLRQEGSRVVTFTEGEMVTCVPAMTSESLEVRLAVLKIIDASAEEIEAIEKKIQAGER